MTDFLVVFVIGIILSVAISYIIKQKKAGAKCIGCSIAGSCAKRCDSDTNPLVSQYRKEEAA